MLSKMNECLRVRYHKTGGKYLFVSKIFKLKLEIALLEKLNYIVKKTQIDFNERKTLKLSIMIKPKSTVVSNPHPN